MTGTDLPVLRTDVPGPASQAAVDILARHECPAVTARRTRRAEALGVVSDDPIVWQSAVGANVQDVDGNQFVDLTSGFGVALVGHRHPSVVRAANQQARKLVHAMGDAWPDLSRVLLLQRLARIAPGDLEVSLLGLSGSDAIDAAIKTAVLATGQTGVITFERSYHGLALGVLGLQGYKSAFTAPFVDITHGQVTHLPWGCDPSVVAQAMAGVGLVLAEPIQGRGGMHTAPDGWLAQIAAVARAHGALFGLDEIQTGMGRTGEWFAGPSDGVVPDLMCVGKALAGGYPLSVCIGTPEVMSAWGTSTGEALHTQTFLGHPVGCAAALASIDVIENGGMAQINKTAIALQRSIQASGRVFRGRGLMGAVTTQGDVLALSRALLRRGWLVLPAGIDSLSLTPPMCLTQEQINGFINALDAAEAEQ